MQHVGKRSAASKRHAAARGEHRGGQAGTPRFLGGEKSAGGERQGTGHPGQGEGLGVDMMENGTPFSGMGLAAGVSMGRKDAPEEHEADAFAAMMAGDGVSLAGLPRFLGNGSRTAGAVLRRSPASSSGTSASAAAVPHAGGGDHVTTLAPAARRHFETRSGADLSDVRLHSGSGAEDASRRIGAKAFTVGSDIWLGEGASNDADVMAHEVGHVVLHGDGETLHRYDDEEAAECTSDPDPPMCEEEAEPVCASDSTLDGAEGDAELPLEARVAAFKQLVRTTAIHRLMANQRNLALWALAVEESIPDRDLGAIGMLSSGGSRAYMELQDIEDPGLRDLRAHQAVGEYRACTGCHIENALWGTREERRRASLDPDEWLSPNARRGGAHADPFPYLSPVDMGSLEAWIRASEGGTVPATDTTASTPADSSSSVPTPPVAASAVPDYLPRPGTLEATLDANLPAPEDLYATMERVRPMLEELGPSGYRVLPASILGSLEGGADMTAIRDSIISTIQQRHADYGELITKIQDGEVGWEHFGPIITDLLPTASEDVQASIRAEMDDNSFWGTVEAVVVGIATIAALLLTIFPPTSIAGIAALGALEIGLAGYGLATGPGMMETGAAYSLGTGANDVFTPDQQDAGGMMVLGGFLSIVMAPLGMASGASRLGTAATRLEALGATSTALARTGSSALVAGGEATARTFQRGGFIVTIAEDGSITATMPSRPDLLIIVRDGTATAYQSMGPGGLRVIESMPVGSMADMSGAGTPLLGAGDPLALPPGAADPFALPAGPDAPLALPAGPDAPLALPAGPDAPLALPPGPDAPLALPPGPDAPLALPPGPRSPLLLGPGNPTALTWDRISRMRQPMLWEEREAYMRELYGAPGERHFPVPGTGGRFVDVPVQINPDQLFAGEVKSYTRWITREGTAMRNEVDLSSRLETQIARDVWLRDNIPGYDPRWIFTDAPPSAALREALRNANIVSITHIHP